MSQTPHLSKDSYAVTNSSTERLCEWRGLNCPAGHEQKTTELISHSVVYLYHYDNKLSLLQLQDSSN